MALAFLAPSLLGMLVFFVFPLVMTVYYSFTAFSLSKPPKFNGLANWRYLFGGDPLIGQATLNTIWFVVVLVPVRMVGALFVSWVLTRARRSAGVLRTLYYLPALIPPVASTIAFVFVLNPATGPVNVLLRHLGVSGPGWFTSEAWAKPSLTFLGLWVLGDLMVIFLAALQGTPQDLMDAALVDGCTPRGAFWRIQVPLLRPVSAFLLVWLTINALQLFDEVYVTTRGGPLHSSTVVVYYLYQQAFQFFHGGYAAAIAVVLFVVILLVTLVQLRLTRDSSAGTGAR